MGKRVSPAASHRLSDSLRKLVRAGILKRVAYELHPRRFEYRLTEKGIDLYPLIVVMIGCSGLPERATAICERF
jgi:DNA-binding HxlR family transcriptional regulator